MSLVSQRPNALAEDAARLRRRALRALPITALLLDLVLVSLTVFIAGYVRSRVTLFDYSSAPGFSSGSNGPNLAQSLLLVAVPMVLGWVALIALRGGYDRGVFGAGADEYKAVVTGSLLAAAVLGIGCYLTRFQLSRGFFMFAFVIGPPLLVLGRWVLRRALHRARRRGSMGQQTVIVGSADHVDAVASILARESWLGYRVAGALVPHQGARETETEAGVPVLGTVDDAARLIRSHDAEIVFVVGGAFSDPSAMRNLVWDLESDDVQVIMAPGVTDVSSERIRVRPVAGMPLLHLDRPRHQDALRWAKRTFDLVGSTLALVLLSPLLAFAAWKIKRYDGGPVLFRQTRVGRDGEFFICLKLRSMVLDAEQTLPDLHTEAGYREGLFKMAEDPRVTKPGQWIRRYSLDELPQLINVLRGDMSLVGPRPPLPSEVDRYTMTQARRLRVRPGMTGLWQVSGRSDLSWSESIRLDLYYVDNWSMIQDIVILARTVGAVLSSRGAY
jgi:exopolysaccharide biosynthesis polyprenyl glycosylphosphotransferase